MKYTLINGTTVLGCLPPTECSIWPIIFGMVIVLFVGILFGALLGSTVAEKSCKAFMWIKSNEERGRKMRLRWERRAHKKSATALGYIDIEPGAGAGAGALIMADIREVTRNPWAEKGGYVTLPRDQI
jgi:hypothetical protein